MPNKTQHFLLATPDGLFTTLKGRRCDLYYFLRGYYE